MPEDTARRIVIVTDGNENVGQAKKIAARVAGSGIGIDVVPVMLSTKNEVLVEKIDIPGNLRSGQPFEARVVVNNYSDNAEKKQATGKLRVTQKVRGDVQLLLEEEITLEPGKNVFPLQHEIDQPAAYVYNAEFIPDTAGEDGLSQNNQATAYTYVRGQGRVLVIQDAKREGDFDLLADVLRKNNIEVDTMRSDSLFGSIAELQPYDAVILAGVPRVSGDTSDQITSFSDAQIEMLVSNTRQLGAGLLMIGGPEAFGAGGWTGTAIEKAMPVDFKSRIRKFRRSALADHARGEMAEGNYWQEVVTKAAIEQLGPGDYGAYWTRGGDAGSGVATRDWK